MLIHLLTGLGIRRLHLQRLSACDQGQMRHRVHGVERVLPRKSTILLLLISPIILLAFVVVQAQLSDAAIAMAFWG